MSAINSQAPGDVGDEPRGANDSTGGAMATEELIAHVLGRAHRKAVANNAPHEARAILHVAHSFADALAETNPRFDRPRFIEASTKPIIAPFQELRAAGTGGPSSDAAGSTPSDL
jgi:hypothetical protein